MSNPYVGEIRLVGFNFPPANWALCNGQLLPISENETLFNLLGTMYGGDGTSTFAVPDLQGRSPLHQGSNSAGSYVIGQKGGAETVTLTAPQMPSHVHTIAASANAGASASPSGQTFAQSTVGQYESSATLTTATMLNASVGGQPHQNLMPYTTMNYIISLYGIYPSQS